MIGTSCEIVEYNHKGNAKMPYQSSNRKDYFPQFVDYDARHAAIELAEEYFAYRDVYEMAHQDSGLIDSLAIAREAGRLDLPTQSHAKHPNRKGVDILAIIQRDAEFANLPSA